jgi:predicted CoA-substrate-specific enzyme activase
MHYFMGIDIGTESSKGVILKDNELAAYHSLPSGIKYETAANELARQLLEKAGLSMENIDFTVATGHGSASVTYSNQRSSDIRCCAKGIHHIFPAARTVIDVGSQTTQVIHVAKNGQIGNFVTSEKCASGSGRFLDIISNVLQIPIEDIGRSSLKSKNPVTFTTACAVFGESETVSRIAEGIPSEDILAGVHKAMADKIYTMIEQVGLEEDCAICGGGGLNIGLIKMLEDALKLKLLVPPHPHIVTALGAALFAKEACDNQS